MKNFINMSRATSTYLGGLGALMVTSLVLSNIPGYGLSRFLDLRFAHIVAGSLFTVGGIFGLLALSRHMSRVKEPWRVPQSQVSIFYLCFLISALLGIIISH